MNACCRRGFASNSWNILQRRIQQKSKSKTNQPCYKSGFEWLRPSGAETDMHARIGVSADILSCEVAPFRPDRRNKSTASQGLVSVLAITWNITPSARGGSNRRHGLKAETLKNVVACCSQLDG